MKQMSGQYSSRFQGSPLFLRLLLFSVVVLPAQCAASGTPDCSASAAEFLNARLAVWQQRLDLADWKITLSPSHPGDLKPQTLGHIDWDAVKKTATVRVLSASDYRTTCSVARDDMELTVVHELVHLVLSRLRQSGTNFRDEEHAVNQLADALLKLDRETRPRPVTMVTGAASGCTSDASSAGCQSAHR
jgi:hypothetical protein